jgi:hypothetical protein
VRDLLNVHIPDRANLITSVYSGEIHRLRGGTAPHATQPRYIRYRVIRVTPPDFRMSPVFRSFPLHHTVDCDVVALELVLRVAARGLKDDVTLLVQEAGIRPHTLRDVTGVPTIIYESSTSSFRNRCYYLKLDKTWKIVVARFPTSQRYDKRPCWSPASRKERVLDSRINVLQRVTIPRPCPIFSSYRLVKQCNTGCRRLYLKPV